MKNEENIIYLYPEKVQTNRVDTNRINFLCQNQSINRILREKINTIEILFKDEISKLSENSDNYIISVDKDLYEYFCLLNLPEFSKLRESILLDLKVLKEYKRVKEAS